MGSETGALLADITGHDAPVTCGAFTPDGRRLVTADLKGTVQIWNSDEKSVERRIEVDPDVKPRFVDLAIDGDGKHVALTRIERREDVYTLELATGRVFRFQYPFAGPVAWNDRSRQWIVGWCERESTWLGLWDPEQGTTWQNPDAGPILAADMSWDGTRFVASHREQQRQTLWNLAAPDEPRTFAGRTQWDDSIAFSPDGRHVVSVGGNWLPKLWDTETEGRYTSLGRLKNWLTAVAYHPDGTRVAIGCYDATATIWNVKDARCLLTLQGHTAPVNDVRFSSDGRWLITASADRSAKIWNVETGDLAVDLPKHPSDVLAAAFGPDGQLVATASPNSIWLWSVDQRRPLHKLYGHEDWPRDIDISPDGRWLVSTGHDGTLRIWDTRRIRDRSENLASTTVRLHPRRGIIRKARFMPDGRHLWTWNANGTIYVLRLSLLEQPLSGAPVEP